MHLFYGSLLHLVSDCVYNDTVILGNTMNTATNVILFTLAYVLEHLKATETIFPLLPR